MTDLIFIQTSDDVIAVGTGPFKRSAQPDTALASFYVNSFFLENPTPWIIPHDFFEVSVAEFKSMFLVASAVSSTDNISWDAVDDIKFRKFFQKIKQVIEEGILEKIVPVQFEYGQVPANWGTHALETLTSRFIHYLSSGLYLFGFQEAEYGFCGLTPELIFEQQKNKVVTAALAGTAASSFGDRSIKNPKDAREHQIVVDDIKTQLAPFGPVTISDTIPYWNGSLIHLRAFLEVPYTSSAPTAFDQLVHAIHPTAALGVYPRSENAHAILKSSDVKMKREYFAAPFGIHFPNNTGLCIAAIRSVFWQQQQARLGAGCGVIEESDIEQELREVAMKRRAIKDKITVA